MTPASLAGILAFLFGTAAVVAGLYAFPQYRRLFLALMVFTTCYVKKPFYQEVFFVNYRGVDRGFGVTLPDLVLTGFFIFLMLGGLRRRVIWLPFNSIPWFVLIAASCLSLIGSIEPYYGTFTVHKLIRCWMLYVVMVNVVRDRRDVMVVLISLASAVLLEGWIVFFEKYITKSVVARSTGSFRHPNTLAMYTDLILPILAAASLTASLTTRTRSLLAAAILAGFVCVLFTKSRAAMILLPASLGTVTMISVIMKPTGRKFLMLGVGAIMVAIIAGLALPRLIRRFENAPKESAETREYFNDAARAMAHDHLFGVGINLFSLALHSREYYWTVYPDKVDVEDPEEFRMSVEGQSRLGTAHHIYWLYAAETGYPGLAMFLVHIALFWGYNLYLFLKERDHLFKSIYLGLLVGVAFHHLHGVLEWIFRQTEVLFLYFVLMGMMVAMSSIRKREAGALRAKKTRIARRNRMLPSVDPSEVCA